ncbi:MAG TPA: 3'-5' exonuclease, partial [Polyangia bacterium]|nr:3'-5' exonuclease [Polyangia bacterium]
FPPRAIQHELGRAKRELIGPEAFPRGDWYREQVARIYELYERRMRDARALDFGDLLYRTVRAMREDAALAAEVASMFDHVMVDEFQDTNLVQLELVRLLAAPHRNVCVVGDDDQSIYSWRGADVTNILEFERHFQGARVVTLDRNYRSTANILKAAHGVVSRLRGRREKQLWTSAPDGARVTVISAPDEREEARLVCQAIRDLRAEGVPLSGQAIFYRINAQSRVFEEVLRALNVPHRVVGGMRFYERAEVKDVLAYLRLIQNPADHTAFVRVVNTPSRGIGKTTVDRLVVIAAASGCSAFDAVIPAAAELSRAPAERLLAFCGMVERWRAEARDPAHLVRRVLEDTGYLAALEHENTAEADARLENVRELTGSIDDFVREAEEPTLATFLELVALQTDVDTVRFDDEQVTLMTVHSAKGLEFDAVYVTGLEDGLFPWRAADASMEDTESELEEERRLAYVAMTRARSRLFLTLARSRRLFGSERLEPPSRFLADLPAGVVEDRSPARPRVKLLDPAGGSRRIPAAPAWKRGAAPAGPRAGQPRAAAGDRDPGEVWVDRSVDQQAEAGSLRPGMAVRHARFGEGQVLAVHAGPRVKADVRFPAFGTKTIVADYLEPA